MPSRGQPGRRLPGPDSPGHSGESSRWLIGAAGFVALIAVWQLLTATLASGNVEWPTPWSIVSLMHSDGWHFYWPNVQTTVWEAIKGFFWGNLVAIALALLILLVPVIEKPLVQLSMISYCLPIVAIGPVLAVSFSGEQPKAILAGMAVFFTTLIGMLVGLRSAESTSLDVIRAFGGGRYQMLVKVRLKASLPSLFGALRIAAPAAVLGAIIGEYLGGDNGLGVAMINSEQSLNIARTWGIALVATALAGLGYAVVAAVGRAVTPWTRAAS
jgi:ABC-type nitrate/sulfonate/bicarbonate transport system permease component